MRRGLTLLEVLVASGLALVALSLTATLFYATATSTTRGQARVDLQQQAVRALNTLVSDLMQCTPASVGVLYATDPNFPVTVLCLHKVVDVTNVYPPEQVFDRQLTVYWRAEGGVFRRLLPDGQPPTLGALGLEPLSQSRPTRGLNQANLSNMVSGGPRGRTRLADHVKNFQVVCGAQLDLPLPGGPPQPYQAGASPPAVTNPLTVCLSLEKEVKGGVQRNAQGNPCETFQLQRTVWLRDGE